jgi:hypothetical protein
VIHERSQNKKTATEGLLWLKRALEFTSKGLRLNQDNKDQELSSSFQKAYEGTLSPFHNFLVRPVFSLAMKACPKRVDFFKNLTATGDEAQMLRQLSEWLAALEAIVAILAQFYITGKHDQF